MKKLLIVAIVLAILLATGATVWGGYFFEDPIFSIDGQTVNVLVGKDTDVAVSNATVVNFLVPRNVRASLVDPQDCVANLIRIAPQQGPLRISLAMVYAALDVDGGAYPVQVTVFDDDGYSLTLNGTAGRWTIVPYIKWR